MLFPEKDAPELKTWIVKHLETPAASDSDVDADVLADYVLALLRHDGKADDVRQLCETELYDFLKDEAKSFVASVFQAVTYQSYKPGARPPPEPSQTPSSLPPLPSGGSKKRSYHESSLPAKPATETAAAATQGNGRAIKQPRRGGRGRENGRGGAKAAAGSPADYLPPPPFGSSGSRENSPSSGTAATPFYPAVPPSMEAFMHMSQMGMPVGMYGFPPGMPGPWGPGANGNGKRPRRRCRYMEKNGFCTKKNCAFDHGDNPLDSDAAAFQAANGFEGSLHPMMQHAEAAAAMFQQMMPPMLSHQGGSAQRGGRKPRRGGRAAFSADGPVFDKNNSTVVVEGIPDEYLSEEAVREFFSQFGTIVSVAMQPKRKLAIVKFDTWASANAAYQSPKVIFDNRFVKVYWHRDEKGDDAEAAAASEDGEVVEGGGEWRANGTESPGIDMEDFLRRQEEAQQRHEEKMCKKQELDRKRQELEQRQRALQARQQEEKQRLIAKMAEVATRARQGSVSGTPSEDGSTPKTAAISQTEMIRAQLAALEEEARQLGLDPDAVAVVTGAGGDASSTTSSSLSFAGRGRGRGRGRGGFFPYRGRGGSGGGSGGGRGGRGGVSSSVSAAYAAYSLDNRPRRVALTGVDFTIPEQGEALRAHLLIVGDFVDIDTTPEKTTIAFVDRRTAEKFYLSAKVVGSSKPGQPAERTIPGVDGCVELAWVPNTASSLGAASSTARTRNGPTGLGSGGTSASGSRYNGSDGSKLQLLDDDDDDDDDNLDAMDGSVDGDEQGEDADRQNRQQEQKHDQHVFPPKPRQQMDFDVADEGDWDIV